MRPLPSVPMRMAPLLPTWYCWIESPASHTALPAAEIEVNTGRAFIDASMSPMRPPQPRVAPSGASACQVLAWSLCENRLAGLGCELWPYCALVVGMTSVPMLGRMASRLSVLNIVCSVPITGCSAKLRPWLLVGRIGSTPPSRAGEPAPAPVFGSRARRQQRDRVRRLVAHRAVVGPRIGVGGQHHVQRVVAAEQEQAHQRLVVGRGLRGGRAHGRQVQRQGRGRGPEQRGHGPGMAQEQAAGSVGVGFISAPGIRARSRRGRSRR